MFTVTEELLLKAKTYMPLADKVAKAQTIAQTAFAPLPDEKEKSHIEKALDLIGFSAVARENVMAKPINLLFELLTFYFGIKFDEEHPFDYDLYAEAHIMNQLERFKANAELRVKIFDLMADYKELKKIVEAEIYNERCVRNDVLRRFNDELSANSDPHKLIDLMNELKAQSEEYKDAIEKAGIVEAAK